MNIALDWDGTVTKDEPFWRRFAENAQASGHRVYVVTKRYSYESVYLLDDVEVIYCDRRVKAAVMNEKNIRIDVWIDNDPGGIIMY